LRAAHGRADHRDFARAGGRPGQRRSTSAASTGSAARLSTNGRPGTAAQDAEIHADSRIRCSASFRSCQRNSPSFHFQ
jgi:hypothetical protein